ncbi:MAG: hypothetical protein LBB89_00760 [Treponema sp.]|jgi:hypothetical protein|nr:hypothetical protein [Treponema sp.]
MTKKKWWLGIPALVLVLGMTVVGCSDGSSGGGDSDPIKVNMSLPNIKDVKNFEGAFVSDETEAKELIKSAIEAMESLDGISISPSVLPASRSMSRSTYTEPYEEIFKNEKLANGVYLTGFIKGYARMHAANDNGGESVGDYMEISAQIKAAIDFDDATQSDFTYNGKYVYDESVYTKAKVTSINPSKGNAVFKFTAKDGYALSVSKNGKGLKFVMKLDASLNFNSNMSLDEFDNGDYLDDLDDKFVIKLTIDVYDNNNVKKPEFCKKFDNFEDANDYLDINISGL